MKNSHLLFFFLLVSVVFTTRSQTISLDPSISEGVLKADEEIEITYDLTETDLSDFEEAWIWLWFPDQENYDVPSNVNPAGSNVNASNAAKFTKVEDGDKVIFSISVVLTDFTDRTVDQIVEVGVLLKGNDWSNGQTSDFIFSLSESSSNATSGTHDILPVITPDFPSASENLTITYKTQGTPLEGIEDAWLWLWLPDLSDVNVPTNINPASGNSITSASKFTRELVNGEEAFSITLTLEDFTNKPAEQINKVGILLKGNDWSNGQTTDHVFEISDGFAMKVNSPVKNRTFYDSGDEVLVDVVTSEVSDIQVTVDGEILTHLSGESSLKLTHQVISDGSVHELRIKAVSGSDSSVFVHSYATKPNPERVSIPENRIDGINYVGNTAVDLVLTAPNKENVFVLGDFNDWKLDQNYLMKVDGDKFWLSINELDPRKEYQYQYLIDGEILIADPFTEKVISSYDDDEITDQRYPGLTSFPSDKTSGETSVFQIDRNEYQWQVNDFERPAKEDLVIYELLVRDFTSERTFKAVTDKLDYLDSLGISALELMPVMEFEGNISWGYNSSFKLAVDKYYGTENDLKELIDEAHKRGIAVILDIVLNHHFGRSPLVQMEASGQFGPPTSENVWFNTEPKHDFNVGFDFNHESTYTQNYVDQVVKYWIDEYRIDGYRFDLSKGFTQKNTLGNVDGWGQYDINRINLLKRMANVIWEKDPGIYVILEHFAANSEERDLANAGMMLWANTRWSSLADRYYKERGWNDAHAVAYMESHDEERMMWENRHEGNLEERLNGIKAEAAFFFMIPGPKMIWQFGEFGYDEELNNDRLGIKPTHWEYLEDQERARLFGLFQSLINLKTRTDYLQDRYFEWNPSRGIRWINYTHPDVEISVFGNLGSQTITGDPHFSKAGEWYNYFTGETLIVENPNDSLTLGPNQFYIYTSEPIDNFISIDPVDFITPVNEEVDFEVFPNPFVKTINIQNSRKLEEIKILDLSGKVVFKRKSTKKKLTITLPDLDPGIYFLEVISENQKIVKKVLRAN